jgi:flagellar assembly protein FliH
MMSEVPLKVTPFEFKALGFRAEDVLLEEEEQPEAPPEPTFTQTEVEAMKQIVHAQGYDEAKKELEDTLRQEAEKRDQTLQNAINTLSAKLAEMQQTTAAQMDAYQKSLVTITGVIAKKLAGEALKEDPTPRIEAAIQKCQQFIAKYTALSITLNPDTKDILEKRFSSAEQAATLTFNADETMPPQDCKIEWPGGGAVLDHTSLSEEVEKVLEETTK